MAAPRSARAQALTFEARSLEADASAVHLQGGVVLGYGRYRLTSDDLVVTREAGSVSLAGAAHLGPCPCPDPPITLGFSRARLDADGDVALTFPRLEVARVPVFALPWILLRSADKPGLLPPILELRGDDGVLLGGGARLPFGRDGEGRSLGAAEVTAAGFAQGGIEIGAALTTPRTSTRLLFDERAGERAVFDARGAFAFDGASGARGTQIAWDVDALRGNRAIAMTPDLFTAARPFDTAAVEAVRGSGAGPVGASVGAGLVARGLRGEGDLVAGPRASAAVGGALGRSGSFDARGDLTVVGTSLSGAATSMASATAGAELDPRSGPFDLRLATRARARTIGVGGGVGGVGGGANDEDPTRESAVAASAIAGLPFSRTFDGADASAGAPPLVHWIEPLLEGAGAVGDRRGDLFLDAFGPLPTSAWELAGGVSSSFGTYAGRAVRLDVRLGGAGFDGEASAMGLARLTAESRVVGASAFVAGLGSTADQQASGAIIARLRLGALAGAWLRLELAALHGERAADARLLEDGLLGEPRFWLLSSDGTSGAVEARMPLGEFLTLRGRADADLDAPDLLAIQGSLRFAGRCRCFAVEVGGSHREGRRGADGIVSIDLAPR